MVDGLLADFPSSCKTHLAHDSRVVSNSNFENAIVKVLGGSENQLLLHERVALGSLAKLSVIDNSDEELPYVEALLAKDACTESHSGFIDLNYIPPTSNSADRLFSQADLVYYDRHQSMHP